MKKPAWTARSISAGMFVAVMAVLVGASAGRAPATESQRMRPFFARGDAWVMHELARNVGADAGAKGEGAGGEQNPFVAHSDSALVKLVQLHREIRDIHPFLAQLQPVAIVRGDTLYVFDVDSTGARYEFKSKGPVPFPLPKGIRASFPLSSYGGKTTCIVSPEVFDEAGGYATIFHEFVHCAQFQTVEPRLKERLEVAQEAKRKNDYSWELNHAFPYQNVTFVKDYSALLDALGKAEPRQIDTATENLRQHLSRPDYEYMVWEEWKEGFARYVENRIRSRLGIPVNQGGAAAPYDRVTFYRGGELFIDYLVRQDKELLTDMEKLFARMLGPMGSTSRG